LTPAGAEARARAITEELRRVGTPARAEGEKRYLKSDLEHFGATVLEIRATARRATRPGISHAELVELVERLWSAPVHESRMAAIMLLDANPKLLTPRDLELVERMLRDARSWAYVDVLAGDVAGAILLRHPDAEARLDRWAAESNFWIKRAALLALLQPLKHERGFERFARYADAMLEEKEFFVRKAIGWVLREEGKRHPDEVFRWLEPRARRASGVTLREAVKYLRPEQRAHLLRRG
jgi:3-methyladenine DNA glycosylase AlkD